MPIFDQGYQHWKGPLSGHAWRWLAVAHHGVRAQLRGRILRLMLLLAWLPALALVVTLAVWGLLEQQAESVLSILRRLLPPDVIAQPRDYRAAVWTIAYGFFFKAELACSLFLVLLVGPNLISRDLRFNALPLYFSRPLRRFDYFLGKLGIIGFFLAATVLVPATGAYLFGIAFSLDFSVVRDTHHLLWAGAFYSLVITVSAGTLMLALSSLSRRSIYVALAWAGFCFLSLLVSSILIGIRIETHHHRFVNERIGEWVRAHPPPSGVQMFGPFPMIRHPPPGAKGSTAAKDGASERWFQDWSDAFQQYSTEAEILHYQDAREDWRPLCSYATNLDRMGDWLLDTDRAWLTLGQAVERSRSAFGSMVGRAGGRVGRSANHPGDPTTESARDRLLADRMVWQYPWYWSGGVLAGLWLLSVWILTGRVKSLDRLK
jgi:ABC-type transport system involved in multi-copper enzyme maturation permease subunit